MISVKFILLGGEEEDFAKRLKDLGYEVPRASLNAFSAAGRCEEALATAFGRAVGMLRELFQAF